MKPAPQAIPTRRAFWIEVPRGAFIKRDKGGRVDFLSPLPCPFNYGCDPEATSADGEGVDVVVLGPRRRRGDSGRMRVRGRVRFVDQGLQDDKIILSDRPLTPGQVWLLRAFFFGYGTAKAAAASLRRRPSPTRFLGLELGS